MKRIWPWLLILLGAALLLGAIAFWLDTLTSTEPAGLGETVRNWLTTLVGLATGIVGALQLLRKPEPAASSTSNAPQTTGPNSPSIVGDGTIVNYGTPLPQAHDSIGYIPPYKGATYIPRGSIENDVRDMLQKGGVGSIVGLHAPGGLGKTELAKRAASHAVKQRWVDGLLWVDVGDKSAPQVVADMLVRCGIQLPPGTAYPAQVNELHAYLCEHRLLVVLDDIRTNAVEGMDDFIPPSPCTTLITSRMQELGAVGHVFKLDRMTLMQARELFAAVLGPDLLAAEAAAIDRLAEYCKYNPLALEIAARRIRQLEPAAGAVAGYLDLLRARFAELHMDGDERWDMAAVFDLSYSDLGAADQKRFRSLGAFHHTGFPLEALSVVWDQDSEPMQALSRFINLSLVKVVEQGENAQASAPRFRLHDLLDQYAALKLQQNSEQDTAIHAVAGWLTGFFNAHYTADPSTAPQVSDELDNLREAAGRLVSACDGNALAALVSAARNWFVVLNMYAEWGQWASQALAFGIQDKGLEANVRQAIGDVQAFRKDNDAALESYQAALSLFQAVGDRLGEANVRQAIGHVQAFRDDNDAALESYQAALSLFQAVGDRLGEANVYARQGQLCVLDDPENADALLDRALQIYEAIGDNYSIPANIGNFGWVLLRLGQPERARPYLLRAAALFDKIGMPDFAERHRTAAGG